MTADDVFTAWSALSGRAGRLPGTATAGTARLAMIEASYPGAEGPAFLLPDALVSEPAAKVARLAGPTSGSAPAGASPLERIVMTYVSSLSDALRGGDPQGLSRIIRSLAQLGSPESNRAVVPALVDALHKEQAAVLAASAADVFLGGTAAAAAAAASGGKAPSAVAVLSATLGLATRHLLLLKALWLLVAARSLPVELSAGQVLAIAVTALIHRPAAPPGGSEGAGGARTAAAASGGVGGGAASAAPRRGQAALAPLLRRSASEQAVAATQLRLRSTAAAVLQAVVTRLAPHVGPGGRDLRAQVAAVLLDALRSAAAAAAGAAAGSVPGGAGGAAAAPADIPPSPAVFGILLGFFACTPQVVAESALPRLARLVTQWEAAAAAEGAGATLPSRQQTWSCHCLQAVARLQAYAGTAPSPPPAGGVPAGFLQAPSGRALYADMVM